MSNITRGGAILISFIATPRQGRPATDNLTHLVGFGAGNLRDFVKIVPEKLSYPALGR